MSKSPRLTQEERRHRTQSKLLDATISCLISDGYSEITTTKVSKISGMSQGAIFKHYPTKNALITASIAKLYDQLINTFETIVHSLPPKKDRIESTLSALWQFFDTPELLAVFDLHIAARTDTEFKKALEPFERTHRLKIKAASERIFPELAANPQFHAAIEIILMAVQGASIGNLALLDPTVQKQREDFLLIIARFFLEVSDG